ncbi:MAG: hypothetical protein ACI867_000305, partial [Glaciecola sp.]
SRKRSYISSTNQEFFWEVLPALGDSAIKDSYAWE